MDLDRYLARIGLSAPPPPDAGGLARLHQAHLLAVPFENLSIAWGEPIALDLPSLHRKVVERRRGGGCFELNLLLAWALGRLGFEVDVLSARVPRDDGSLGPEFDHLCLRVKAGGVDLLADVGFGDSFRRPIPMVAGRRHPEGRRAFALEGEGGALDLLRWQPDQGWRRQYRFTLQPREAGDFAAACAYHQTSPEAPFTGRRLCSLATADGRLTLTDRALVRTTLDGGRSERPLADEAAWAEALRTHFGIEPPGSAGPPR